MKFQEFSENVQREYAKRFPHSKCSVKVFDNLGKSALIDCYLAGDSKECIHGYWDNDIFKIKANIDFPKTFDRCNDELPENLTIEWYSHCYFIKPETSYTAYGMRNISVRKTSGKPEKLVKDFGKFFDRLKKSVVEDYKIGKIHENHLALVRTRLTN